MYLLFCKCILLSCYGRLHAFCHVLSFQHIFYSKNKIKHSSNMFSLGMFKGTGCLMYIKYVHIGVDFGWVLGISCPLLGSLSAPLLLVVLQGPELHGTSHLSPMNSVFWLGLANADCRRRRWEGGRRRVALGNLRLYFLHCCTPVYPSAVVTALLKAVFSPQLCPSGFPEC